MQKQTQTYIISAFLMVLILFSSFYLLNDFFLAKQNNTEKLGDQISQNSQNLTLQFNGTRAFSYLKDQVDIGFRPPNSTQIEQTRVLIISQLMKFNWIVELNNFTYMGVKSVNILAFPANADRHNVTLFGAHYDTRWYADDPQSENKTAPVMGANDGASGVAALMEFAQIFAHRKDVGLLFIDAEDQGNIDGWVYGAGAEEFVNSSVLNTFFPNGKSDIRVFVLLDMIGDWHLNIKMEGFSNITYNSQIWYVASLLNYGTSFTNDPGYYIIDDHIPFLEAGIPAVDLIDFDYKDENGTNLHHTTHDTLQYVSASSLSIVGQTIEYWILTYNSS